MPDEVTLGEAALDLKALLVTRAGASERLTLREADMVKLLWRNAGRTVPRRRFLKEVWGHDRAADDPHRRPARRETAPEDRVRSRESAAHPDRFGVGYRLEEVAAKNESLSCVRPVDAGAITGGCSSVRRR